MDGQSHWRRLLNRLLHRVQYRAAWSRHHVRNTFLPHASNYYRPHALRRPMLNTYAAVIVAVKVITVVAIGLYAGEARLSDVTTNSIITLTNQARQEQNLAKLKTNALLTKAAESKAQDMVKQQYFAHISPKGTSPWTWFKQAGYSYSYAGENLAIDYVSSEDVIAAWLNSPTHRSNLLGKKYQDIGVAVVSGKINGATSLVVVQMFGTPTPKPATKKVTVPAQTPTPAATKKVIAATPAPTKVLGEETETPVTQPVVVAPPVAPEVPTVLTPDADSLVRTAEPEIIGRAEPGSVATLYINGAITATAPVETSGMYTLVPGEALPDGQISIQVSATARGLTSGFSPIRTISVDTQPPTVAIQQAIILPSLLSADRYDVQVAVDGQPSTVTLKSATTNLALVPRGSMYVGQIQLANAGVTGTMTVSAADLAGNQYQGVLADPNRLTAGVVASTGGPIVAAFRLIFFSRAFLSMFLILLFIVATLNIVVQWRHQHHPTIIASLLVLFLGSTILFM